MGPYRAPSFILIEYQIGNRFQDHLPKCLYQFYNVPTTGFEPAHPLGHYHLKVARLPISPRGFKRITKIRQVGIISYDSGK